MTAKYREIEHSMDVKRGNLAKRLFGVRASENDPARKDTVSSPPTKPGWIDIGAVKTVTEFFEFIPNPDIGFLGRPRTRGTLLGEEVFINNAGMRCRRNFRPKAEDVFRIVVLGDSYVLGHGVAEEDRVGDQLEAFYRNAGITEDGRAIEVLSVGLSGWTLFQEASYLTSYYAAYQPDLIIVLTVGNDISTNSSSHALGNWQQRFSPEEYAHGSGFFSDDQHLAFGMRGNASAMRFISSPTADQYWRKATEKLAELENLQKRNGAKMLVSVMNPLNMTPTGFSVRFMDAVADAGISSPLQMVTFLACEETMVPNDGHPNRHGHSIIMRQYAAALDNLGWIALAQTAKPQLEEGSNLCLDTKLNRDFHDRYLDRFIAKYLHSTIDFTAFSADVSHAFLGGILPFSQRGKEPDSQPPFAAGRAGLVMKKPSGGAAKVRVTICIPEMDQLYPLCIRLLIDGQEVTSITCETMKKGGIRTFEAPLPPDTSEIVELVFLSDRHFSQIGDNRTLSFALHKIEIC